MDQLAERGARTGRVRGGEAPAPLPPPGGPPTNNGPYVEERPQGGVEERPQGGEERPQPEERPQGGPGRQPWRGAGGEAKAGRSYYAPRAVRVKPWRQRWSPACWDGASRSRWYQVQQGDSLWSIAEMHYGFGGAYPHILSANRQSIADASLIFPCQCLYIPRR
jgi:nucleoid-associated protein YgaU